MVQFFDRYVHDTRAKDRRKEKEREARAQKPELIYDRLVAGADDASAQDSFRPTLPQLLCPPLSPRLSPKSTPSNEVDALQIFLDPNDADSESPLHPIAADDPTPVSSGRHNSAPFATKGEQEASGAPPPGSLPSLPQRKRKRDGPWSISGSGGAADTTVGDFRAKGIGVGQVTEAPPPAK